MSIKVTITLCLLFLLKAGTAQTTLIPDFGGLMEALNSGEEVRVVIQYNQCHWQDSFDLSPIPNASAGLLIDTWEYFAKGAVRNKNAFVVFSSSKLIQNPTGKGFVYNYGKVRINEDNTVEITSKYIHPKTFKVLMDEVFAGKLHDGKNDEGISLFK
jgi:hypothetical protein